MAVENDKMPVFYAENGHLRPFLTLRFISQKRRFKAKIKRVLAQIIH
jgi:hypothetical protein